MKIEKAQAKLELQRAIAKARDLSPLDEMEIIKILTGALNAIVNPKETA